MMLHQTAHGSHDSISLYWFGLSRAWLHAVESAMDSGKRWFDMCVASRAWKECSLWCFVAKLWSSCNESAVSPSRIRHFDIPTWSVLGAKFCFFKVKVHFGAVGGISVIPVGFPHAIRTTKSTLKGVTHRLFNAQGLILEIWSHFTAGVLDTDFGWSHAFVHLFPGGSAKQSSVCPEITNPKW